MSGVASERTRKNGFMKVGESADTRFISRVLLIVKHVLFGFFRSRATSS